MPTSVHRHIHLPLLRTASARDLDRVIFRKKSQTADMMAMFVTSVVSGQRGGFASTDFSLGDLSDEAPSIIVGTADHADPDEVRDELALGMGDLFGDD
jgi:hypothetical protein